MKLNLVLDKTTMPADRLEIRREMLGTLADDGAIIYEKPPENLSNLVDLREQPLLNVAKVAANGGKELSPEAKTFVSNGYYFYQMNLGINLGPSNKYTFVQAKLSYELLMTNENTRLTIFDIFPQTTYEEKLKISGNVGLDVSLGYKVASLPLDASAQAKFAIEPKPWIWKVATIESTGQGTLKARWLFKIDEDVANLQTSMVAMTKSIPPISVKISGWVEIDPGFLYQNYYYNIEPVKINLEE